MSLDLHAIEKVCKSQGGISSIFYFDMANVDLSSGSVQFIDADQVYGLQFRRNQARYSERSRDTDGGITYRQTLTATVPLARQSVEELVKSIGDNRIGIHYVDRNGFERFLLHMKMTVDYGSGRTKSDNNAYQFKFERTTTKRDNFIAGQIDIGVIIPGGNNGGTTTNIFTPKYYRGDNLSGSFVAIPFELPADLDEFNARVFLFREGAKLARGHEWGYTVVAGGIEFTDPLDDETIELILRP